MSLQSCVLLGKLAVSGVLSFPRSVWIHHLRFMGASGAVLPFHDAGDASQQEHPRFRGTPGVSSGGKAPVFFRSQGVNWVHWYQCLLMHPRFRSARKKCGVTPSKQVLHCDDTVYTTPTPSNSLVTSPLHVRTVFLPLRSTYEQSFLPPRTTVFFLSAPRTNNSVGCCSYVERRGKKRSQRGAAPERA